MDTTGIKISRSENGIPTFARIDLRKYGAELKDFFASKGIHDYAISNPGLDEAIEDVKNNRVYKAANAKDLISQCLK